MGKEEDKLKESEAEKSSSSLSSPKLGADPIVQKLVRCLQQPVLWGILDSYGVENFIWSFSCNSAAIICPVVARIIVSANSAVIIGLWPAHFLWTYYCILRTKRLGPVLKIMVLIALPVPLIFWPIIGIVGSLLAGIGYGFFAPFFTTFEAVGANVTDKCYHCFVVTFSLYFRICLSSNLVEICLCVA